jgi:hypothetical protein
VLPVPEALLKRLRLEEAIDDEAKSWQVLLPPTPGWAELADDKEAFARWLHGQLRAGLEVAPNFAGSS